MRLRLAGVQIEAFGRLEALQLRDFLQKPLRDCVEHWKIIAKAAFAKEQVAEVDECFEEEEYSLLTFLLNVGRLECFRILLLLHL